MKVYDIVTLVVILIVGNLMMYLIGTSSSFDFPQSLFFLYIVYWVIISLYFVKKYSKRYSVQHREMLRFIIFLFVLLSVGDVGITFYANPSLSQEGNPIILTLIESGMDGGWLTFNTVIFFLVKLLKNIFLAYVGILLLENKRFFIGYLVLVFVISFQLLRIDPIIDWFYLIVHGDLSYYRVDNVNMLKFKYYLLLEFGLNYYYSFIVLLMSPIAILIISYFRRKNGPVMPLQATIASNFI